MNKSLIPGAFVIILTLLFSSISVYSAYAEELNAVQTADYEPSEAVESTAPSEFVTPTTEPIIPAKFPALTVNAISNFFPKSNAEYNVNTKEITVTYWLRSAKNLQSVKWLLSYDSEALSFSLAKNPSANVCPSIGANSVMSFPEKGKIGYCASSMTLFDFSSQDKPFVQIVFDVMNISPDEPILSKIDLTVENMTIADFDKTTGKSDPKSEIVVVEDSIENPELDPLTERLTKMTTLTASNFIQATESPSQAETAQVTDQNGSVIAYETVVPQTSSASADASQLTEPSKPAPVPTEPPTEPVEYGSVPTGGIGYALICLVVITASAMVLFVMRKKEIMF